MDLARFKEIIGHNRSCEGQTEESVSEFCDELELKRNERRIFDNYFLGRLAAAHLIFSFYLPLRSQEIGACCYDNGHFKYIFVNSAIPKANMNFAFAHELYHAFFRKESGRQASVEVFLDEEYAHQEQEMCANAFAGAFLIPEAELRKVWNRPVAGEGIFERILRISDYFGTPYMATLIRIAEQGYLEGQPDIGSLVCLPGERIRHGYLSLCLDTTLLDASGLDNYEGIRHMLSAYAGRLVENGYFEAESAEMYLKNVEEWYLKIREGQDG